MNSRRDIRRRIRSIESTAQLTRAMQMVAASKMRKAQDRMRATRPYGDKIRNIAAHLAFANPEYKHPFLARHEGDGGAKGIGLLVVTTDKGLCGGLNTNALRLAFTKIKEWQGEGRKIHVSPIGNKGFGFMQRLGAQIASHVTGLGDTPHLDKLIGPVKVQLDLYTAKEIDALHIVYTRFINTMKQEPVIEQLLPLPADRMKGDEHAAKGTWDYIYEPDPREVLEQLLVRYIEQIVYQSVAENMASEQSARMVAMKAASDNAKTVIDDLTLVYNKTRQAAITKELSEIVGGAAAV